MRKMRAARRLHFALMTVGGSIVLAVLCLIALETALRTSWPQLETIVDSNAPSLSTPDREIGAVLRPEVRMVVRSGEFTVEYQTNNLGLRGRTKYQAERDAGVRRILLLGDSFTFGQGVSLEDLWTVRLERNLNQSGSPVEVVNAGIPSYDTRQQFLFLQRIAPQLNPDAVVLVFLPNDLYSDNVPSEESGEMELTTTTESQRSSFGLNISRASNLHSVAAVKRIVAANDYLFTKLYSLTSRKQYYTVPFNRHVQRQIDFTKNILKKTQEYCQSRNIQFLILSVPQQSQVLIKSNDFNVPGIDPDAIDRAFQEFAAEQGLSWIPALDILMEAYRERGEDLFYRVDGHLNPLGNAVLGEWFANEMTRRLEDRVATDLHEQAGNERPSPDM